MSCLAKSSSMDVTLSCLFLNVMEADFRTVARGMGNTLPPSLPEACVVPESGFPAVFSLPRSTTCPETTHPFYNGEYCSAWNGAMLTLGITVLPVLQKSACCMATHKPFLCCRASCLLHILEQAGRSEGSRRQSRANAEVCGARSCF